MDNTRPSTKKKPADEQDIEITLKEVMAPFLPPGVYTVGFKRGENRFMWKREIIILWFAICDEGDWFGRELFMSCSVPKDGRWTLNFKFVRNWMLAAGRRPDRLDRLSTKVFRGKWFQAKVKTVLKTAKGEQLIDHARYSVIDELTSKI